jgi:hypothetical protein
MHDLIAQLNEIRMRNGQDPIDPTTIVGVGPSPDDPALLSRIAEDIRTVPIASPDPPSPLVELAKAVEPPEQVMPRQVIDHPQTFHVKPNELMVEGYQASFMGNQVRLSEAEKASVASIVIRAFHKPRKP